jgi:hypothetical protein
VDKSRFPAWLLGWQKSLTSQPKPVMLCRRITEQPKNLITGPFLGTELGAQLGTEVVALKVVPTK